MSSITIKCSFTALAVTVGLIVGAGPAGAATPNSGDHDNSWSISTSTLAAKVAAHEELSDVLTVHAGGGWDPFG